MPYLVAAVALVGALALINLVLTLGVVRRLRAHADQLSTVSSSGPAVGLTAGQSIGEFAATTLAGELLTPAALSGTTLVGFFSLSCGPCEERLPEFVARARDDKSAIAVIVGPRVRAEAAAAELTDVARVLVEEPGGLLVSAFGVRGFPALFLVAADGRVVDSSAAFTRLAALR